MAEFEELLNRMQLLAIAFRKIGWEKQAEMLESTILYPTAGTPVVTLLVNERDELKELAYQAHKGSCKGYTEIVAKLRVVEAELKVLRGIK